MGDGPVTDDDLARFVEAKLLELSPFLVDREERARQEGYVHGTVAHLFAAGVGPVVPPLPRVQYRGRMRP